ncbi:MAG: response regulator [Proteobacteria bacterium]|nr:MAG: response regulator [Pseudomonadota bacterium]
MAKILIVDDSETLRIQLREALEEAGHSVVEGVDGADGLRVAGEHADINMIITDFNMPQMDGVTMAAKIREKPHFQTTPILMLTTEATPDIKAAGKSAGILAWIVKPLVPSKVLPAIEKVLARGS